MLKRFITLENGLKKLREILASFISYDNSTSGLTATDVQAAIDEIAADSSDLCIGGVGAEYIHTDPNCVGGGDANGN